MKIHVNISLITFFQVSITISSNSPTLNFPAQHCNWWRHK